MTPQAKALRAAVAAAVGPGKVDVALRAVVSGLGEPVAWRKRNPALPREGESVSGSPAPYVYSEYDNGGVPLHDFHALLEASGADR